jgi:tRNA U34 5-methylaminomethyl-2-thiouridine-forming methyltransferase MnmC
VTDRKNDLLHGTESTMEVPDTLRDYRFDAFFGPGFGPVRER